MLATGAFPDRLKYSEIKPIFKKGDKTQFENYRPISVTSSIFQNFLKCSI